MSKLDGFGTVPSKGYLTSYEDTYSVVYSITLLHSTVTFYSTGFSPHSSGVKTNVGKFFAGSVVHVGGGWGVGGRGGGQKLILREQ